MGAGAGDLGGDGADQAFGHLTGGVDDRGVFGQDGLEGLGAKVSAPKSVVNASSWTLARAVTRLIRT